MTMTVPFHIRLSVVLALLPACAATAETTPPQAAAVIESPPVDIARQPMRILENDRLVLGVNLAIGGAITLLSDKKHGGNMINSFDWGRQIQLSYYSGPVPFLGPGGQRPHPQWKELGWNPIQAGCVGNIPSRTTLCETGPGFLRVRCIPMQWPLVNVPGDCDFEVTHRLVAANVVEMQARLINRRIDRKQYPAAHSQEMPAVYTNGRYYRLVTYLGDQPFTGGPLTTLVDKSDGKGWPWLRFLASEHWAALVDEQGNGVGVYQPDTASFTGGFAGGDSRKGRGGPKDVQAGYLAPLARRILDHDIDWTYRTHLVVGSLEEIRAHANRQPQRKPTWNLDADRQGWHYEHATDAGWPIRGGLDVRFTRAKRGATLSDEFLWQAGDFSAIEIEAGFTIPGEAGPHEAEIRLIPFGPADRATRPAWPITPDDPGKDTGAPPAVKPVSAVFRVDGGGEVRTYRIPLRGLAGYAGAMKQIQLHFPAADGQARIKRIAMVP